MESWKCLLKTMGKKKYEHRKIVLLVTSKLNSIEKMLSRVLADSDISHDKFALLINEEQTVLGWKKASIEHGKRIKINEIYTQAEWETRSTIRNQSIKLIEIVRWCWLKCRKNTKNKNPEVKKTKNGRIMLLFRCAGAAVKNPNSTKSKKLSDC